LPRTFPSWTTLLTGRYPQHHGIRSMFPRYEERTRDFDALPARLTDAGYTTVVTSDYAGDIFGRIDLGFGRAEVPSFDLSTLARERALERETPLLPFLVTSLGRDAFPALRSSNTAADPDVLAGDAVRLLTQLAPRPDPFFLTVFFSTVHFPYAAPDPWERAFTRPGYRGRFKYDKPITLGDGAGLAPAAVDAEDETQLRGLYDGAVASVDAAAARILAALHRLGRDGDTLVVITADHGETLYDGGHGEGHGDHLFGDEAVHVPLVIVDPRRPGGRIERALVRDVDLAPTLYALTGTTPPADLDGRSLVPALDGAPLASALAFAETGLWFTRDIAALPPAWRLPYPAIGELLEADDAHGGQLVLASRFTALTRLAKHRMARDDQWKLLYLPTRQGPICQLFDTVADPLETRDVAAEHPEQVARLRTELLHWMLEDPTTTLLDGMVVPRAEASR
jgi:arylsulfatase A-like enzyme